MQHRAQSRVFKVPFQVKGAAKLQARTEFGSVAGRCGQRIANKMTTFSKLKHLGRKKLNWRFNCSGCCIEMRSHEPTYADN